MKRMLPEVQKLVDDLQAADEAYAAKRGAITDKYGAHRTEYTKLRNTLNAARQAAWNALQDGEGNNPLAAYIAAHHRDEYQNVLPLLRQLPLTREQLDEYVAAKDCGEWNAAYEQAIDAGVVPEDGPGLPPKHRALRAWVRRNVGRNNRARRDQLNELIDAAIAEAKAPADEPSDAVAS